MSSKRAAILGSNAFTCQVTSYSEVFGHEAIDQSPYFLYGLGRLAMFLDPGKTPVNESGNDPEHDIFVELPFKEIVHYDCMASIETYHNVKVLTAKNSFGDLNYVCTFTDDSCAFGWIRPEGFDLQASYICNQLTGFFRFTVDEEMLSERYPKIPIGRFLEACDYFLGFGSIRVQFFSHSRPTPSPVASQMVNDVLDELAR